MYKLKDSLLSDSVNCNNPFLLFVIISPEHLNWSIMSKALCSQHLLQTSIVVSSLWLIRENLKGTLFIWGKPLQPWSFKGAYLFHRTKCNNFCLYPPDCFMVNVLIWQVHNSNWSYSLLSIVNFFRRAILDISSCQRGFRNSCFFQRAALFGVLSLALVFFSGYCSF